MLSDARNGIRTIALAHERLCDTENLSHINMGESVSDLAERLMLRIREVCSLQVIRQGVNRVCEDSKTM